MSKLSRCPNFCWKNIQILLIHFNPRWTKGNLVAADFQVYSVIWNAYNILEYILGFAKIFSKIQSKSEGEDINQIFPLLASVSTQFYLKRAKCYSHHIIFESFQNVPRFAYHYR